MRHDLVLTLKKDASCVIIVDTKYKIRENRDEDDKQGISQSDLYQVTSYCFRRGSRKALLLYPNYSSTLQEDAHFTVSSAFKNKDVIDVVAAEIPFWNINDFFGLEQRLIAQFSTLLKNIV
jgi:5-methylcytosine-specific restriction enzyme subunit McrC